ncbi:MAG TPA: hypothetical protein DCQ10_11080 [Rhodobacteraceae bacterium]|nr:hypothetical protein [Paracoccaceae bacterium]
MQGDTKAGAPLNSSQIAPLSARLYRQIFCPQRLIVRQSAQQLTIDFIDNGSGISNEDQNLIFEKFSRIGGHESGGAGLGLAISREILQRLQGDITYLPGQNGAAFRIRLPESVVGGVARTDLPSTD